MQQHSLEVFIVRVKLGSMLEKNSGRCCIAGCTPNGASKVGNECCREVLPALAQQLKRPVPFSTLSCLIRLAEFSLRLGIHRLGALSWAVANLVQVFRQPRDPFPFYLRETLPGLVHRPSQ